VQKRPMSTPQETVVVQVHGVREAVQDAAGRLPPVGPSLIVVYARLVQEHTRNLKQCSVASLR
jgi:hypothetical protein